VTIQLAWRRYKMVATTPHSRKLLVPLVSSLSLPRQPAGREAATDPAQTAQRKREKLRMYTAIFISPKPQD
jgi:hypothetical protein